MSAEEPAAHLKDSTDTDIKHGDTVMFNTNALDEFDECILNEEFQDIEDQIVGFYLMTKPMTRSTKHVREKIQTHLIPLYTMVRDSLEASRVQRHSD